MDCPSPSPLEYFAALVADDDSLSLTEAAAAIAQAEEPTLDLESVLTRLDALAARLRGRLPADAPALHRVRALHRFLYEEQGFGGPSADPVEAADSHLHQVLARRRGIPVALAVVYLELAGQIGLQADGLGFPGHFLVKLHLPMGEAVIDPVDGRSLSREDLQVRLEATLPDAVRDSLADAGALGELLAEHLQPSSAREILARMLRNLAALHRDRGDLGRLLQIQQRQVVLEPEEAAHRRDRGLTLADMGRTEQALADLEAYVRQVPAAPDRGRMLAQIAALREAGPPRWH
ncbi:MAG: hypothetical protein RL456_595 [Pseudomonadota bacterium]|jgi:regulator of sirC expression with transglutaminase-like and TPR domain